MIGIALKEPDTQAVAEFFQLFKTPWEYVRPDQTYAVVIGDMNPALLAAKLVIVIQHPRQTQKPVMLRCGETVFPVYSGVSTILGGTPLVRTETGECVGSQCCDNNKIIIRLGYDFFAESVYQISNGQPVAYADWPTLDIHIANLRNWLLAAGLPLREIPPAAADSRFFACLTHDVDFGGIRHYRLDPTLLGFLYRALLKSPLDCARGRISAKMLLRNWLAVTKLPLVYLGWLEDFWSTFRQYRKIEGAVRSTFFLCRSKTAPVG